MNTQTKPRRSDPWVNLPDPADQPEPGYDAYVRAALEQAQAELDAGQGIPAAEVWKELGIE
jgi:hypothetical protein